MRQIAAKPGSCTIRVTKVENYGSARRPLYSIGVELELQVEESPDMLHRVLTDTGLIGRETIPFAVVSNFRGSVDYKPFYAALIQYEGELKRYEVAARDTGGLLKTAITYEPVVRPEELRLHHPADFARLGITVEDWELHNYRHYFMLFIASKRYESFDIRVAPVHDGEDHVGRTAIHVTLTESELKGRLVPCAWYVKRLEIFEGVDLEGAVRAKLEATG
jgi:hypothetical protein